MKHEIFIQTDPDGKLISGKRNLVKAFQMFAGKRLRLTIELYRSRRSNQQNRYLHGVVFGLIQDRLIELGWNEAQSQSWVKEYCKSMFLKTVAVNEKTGETVEYVRGSSSLTTSEMMDFIANLQQWSAENLDLYIPDPGQQGAFFHEQTET